ncbi:MAG: hypothetical protein BWY77_01202 [bacterium ADurb.Bin431]|nr:MAG: hypothetical protein BWY77_01202 [bacterium ADurb.Bin431]
MIDAEKDIIATTQPVAGIDLGAAAEFLRWPLGDDVNDAGLGRAVLGVESAADDLQLLDHGVFDDDVVAAALVVGIGHRHAVDEIGDLAAAAAAEMEFPIGADDAGLELDHFIDGGYRHHLHSPVGDHRSAVGAIHLDGGALGLDGHLLALDHLLLQSEILLGGAIDADSDVGEALGAVTDEARGEGVTAGGNIDDLVKAICVGHRPSRRPLQDNIDPEQRLARLAVCHLAADFAGRAGLERTPCGQEHEKQENAAEGIPPAACFGKPK